MPGHRAVVVVLLLLVSAACRADTIDAIVGAEMKRQHIPGLSLAIVKDGKVAKLRGYGLANVEHRAPATPDTMFQSASVGKQFTAALVMLLVEDGKLALDAPVTAVLPQAPPAWSAITLRHLLNHTSGLPQEDGAIDLQKNYSDDELLQSMFRLPLASPPGQKWVYSDLGYQVLGIVSTRAGGRFYGDQLRERLFAPLGMDARINSERDLVRQRAAGYDREGGALFNQAWVSPSLNRTGDGSLLLSARDLAKWSVALAGGRPLSAAMRQAMWTATTLNDGSRFDYGFGWELRTEARHRSVRHAGAGQGFSTYTAHYPDDRLAIVVLTNRSRAQPQAIVERLTGLYLPALRKAPPRLPTQRALDATALYLRGSMNDWGLAAPLRRVQPGLWMAEAELAAGRHRFKIASQDWQRIDLGSVFDEGPAALGQARPAASKGENFEVEIARAGLHRVTLDARNTRAPTVSITAVAAP